MRYIDFYMDRIGFKVWGYPANIRDPNVDPNVL